MALNTRSPKRRDETFEETFPASDLPSFMRGTDHRVELESVRAQESGE